MLKKILIICVFLTGLSASADNLDKALIDYSKKSILDNVIITLGAKSDHLVEGNFNEREHNWFGIDYRFIENEDYSVQSISSCIVANIHIVKSTKIKESLVRLKNFVTNSQYH